MAGEHLKQLSATEKLSFNLIWVLINLNLSSQMWLVGTACSSNAHVCMYKFVSHGGIFVSYSASSEIFFI